ncbi:MAG: translation initiation factor IF-2 [Deltaproteobacteria bacterium]|nr:translation initiation factor IF-2 [Deltaproteobacteria bacterium]
MAAAKIGVRELAKELGVSDRDLLDVATKVNIRPVMNMLEPAQAMILRTKVRAAHGGAPAAVPASPSAGPRPVVVAPAVRPATPPPPAQAAARAPLAPTAGKASSASKAPPPAPLPAPPPVLRRRAATAADTPAEPVAAPQPTVAVVVEPPAAVEVAPQEEPAAADTAPVPAPTTANVAPAVEPAVAETAARPPARPGNVPRIRRFKASDLEVPAELHLRIHQPAPQPEPSQEAKVGTDASLAPTEVGLATPTVAAARPDSTAPTPESPPPAEAKSGPRPVAGDAKLPDNDPRAFAARRKAAEAAAEANKVVTRLEDIGKALDTSGDLPSTSKRPTLRRMAMPEVLVNLPPKPAARPASDAVAPAPVSAVDEFGVRRVVEAPAADAGRGGRKLIYDRHRDSQSAGLDGRGRSKKKAGKGSKVQAVAIPAPQPTKAEKRHLRIEDTITVANLAHQMSVKATEVIKKLFSLGMMATVNQPLDLDTVELVATDFGFTVENVGFDLEQYLQKPADTQGTELPRSPVVTVMGHVDHGKTSLLDAIRKTHTAAREAGGITQHIGAYVAQVPGTQFEDGQPRRVVFLDTPGHEAFSAMRARGAKATDVIVLVVAADDGVMPQTVEAISHAKAAKVPIVVAVNKIDKPGADIDKVRRELADHGVVAEEWGGDCIFVEVSAKTGQNLDKMLEMLALQADLLELKANAECDSRGLVIESRLEKGRGPVATLLVQAGTLRKGQFIVAGSQYCRVRAMLDDAAKNVDSAGPSTPVEVIGFDHVTVAGDEFYVVADEKKAKAIVEHRIEKSREKELLKTAKRTLEDMFGHAGEPQQRELNLIVKADVHGSAEALKQALSKIEHEEVKVRVLHAAVGGVTESDINLGATTKGFVIAFNVKPEAKGKRLADELGVQIRQYSVIYDAIDDVTVLLEGMLTPIIEEVVLGHAEIRQIFTVPKLGVVAGSHVTDGALQRNQRLRVLRAGEVVHEGEFASLKRFKDDAKEVAQGYDCGIGIAGFTKFQVGDVVQCYELKKIPRKLKPEGAGGGRAIAG